MLAVHFGPRPQRDTSIGAWLLNVPYGKASILFALVAGVGVSILARRRPEAVVARLLYRSAWLLPLGLGLTALDHPVAVILQYYAVWFFLAALFVGVPSRWLLAVALPWLLLGSVAVAWIGVQHPDWLLILGGESPGGLAMRLWLTGFYPTVTWFPVVLVGMWVGRLDLSSGRVRVLLLTWGAAVAMALWLLGHALGEAPRLGSWDVLRSVEGHSEMPLAVIATTAFAVAVLAACLLVASRTRLVRPLAAMGEAALTVYVGQLVIWHFTGDVFDSTSTGEAWATTAWFTVVASTAMWVWLARFSRGPLEAAVRWPFEWLIEPILDLAAGRPARGFLSGLAAAPKRASSEADSSDDPTRSPLP